MKNIALIVINHDLDIDYDNHIDSIMKKNLEFYEYKVISLKNNKCTKDNLIKSIRKIKKEINRDDKFIFYYSGHTVWSPWKKKLLFLDFKPYHVLHGTKAEWISNNHLIKLLTKIKCSKSLMFDTCCGPLIQMICKGADQVITVSDKIGKTKPIFEDNTHTPVIAYNINKMIFEKKKYSSFEKYKKNSKKSNIKISFSNHDFTF
jgi:hypothetical protein